MRNEKSLIIMAILQIYENMKSLKNGLELKGVAIYSIGNISSNERVLFLLKSVPIIRQQISSFLFLPFN